MRNDTEATMRCEYCLDKEWEENDEILLCDMCNASAHVKCCMKWDAQIKKTGKPPEEDWYCLRCSQPKDIQTSISCYLCEKRDGLLIQTKKG